MANLNYWISQYESQKTTFQKLKDELGSNSPDMVSAGQKFYDEWNKVLVEELKEK